MSFLSPADFVLSSSELVIECLGPSELVASFTSHNCCLWVVYLGLSWLSKVRPECEFVVCFGSCNGCSWGSVCRFGLVLYQVRCLGEFIKTSNACLRGVLDLLSCSMA